MLGIAAAGAVLTFLQTWLWGTVELGVSGNVRSTATKLF